MVEPRCINLIDAITKIDASDGLGFFAVATQHSVEVGIVPARPEPRGRTNDPTPRKSLGALSLGFALGMLVTVLVAGGVYFVTRHYDNPGPTVHQDFSQSAGGVVDQADSGQIWANSSNGTPGASLRVIDGRLTNIAAEDQPAAGYISVDLAQSVAYMTASFEFAPGSTDGGAVGLLVRTDVPLPLPVGAFRFTSPAHLAIGRRRMDFGVANDGQVSVIGSEQYDKPLEPGRLYSTRVELDYVNALARVEGPDGKIYVYSDPRIRLNRGNIASFEVFQQLSATDDRAAFTAVSAG